MNKVKTSKKMHKAAKHIAQRRQKTKSRSALSSHSAAAHAKHLHVNKAVPPKAATNAARKPEVKKRVTAKEKREKLYIPEPKLAKEALNAILADEFAADYLKKNVSKNAIDVLGAITTPKTAEQVSEILEIKINFVRSMLNIMQGYGVTNYYVAKNDNGWLSFAWYINTAKLQSFFDYIRSMKGEEVVIRDDCNDYFVCGKCYNETRLIFAFDAAYEAMFKCKACGSKFKMITKAEAEDLVKARTATVRENTQTRQNRV